MAAGFSTEGNYVMEIASCLFHFTHGFLFLSSKFCTAQKWLVNHPARKKYFQKSTTKLK